MSEPVSSEVARARDALLALLGGRFGIDGRPKWLLARVERAVWALAQRLGSAGAVVDHLKSHPEELSELAERLRVGETRFFRDPDQWQLLGEKLLPELVGSGRLRALSAGCSTGEEAWTLAMLLARASEGRGLVPSVVGVDRSKAALDVARAGLYPALAARSMPLEFQQRYLDAEGETLRVKVELLAQVRFIERDLLARPALGSFGLVVCKNLLIYLEPEARRRLVEWLLSLLEPEGALLVARSEISALRTAGARIVELGPGLSVVRASRGATQ
jgi:chemotaxis methyl-accepting protein methylase